MSSTLHLFPTPPTLRPGSQRDAAHLTAVLNGIDIGLLSFDGRLGVHFINDRLARMLDVEAEVAGRCASVPDLLRLSSVLDSMAAQSLHETCLRALSGIDPHPVLTLSSACGQRSFSLQFTCLGADWIISMTEVTARRLAEAAAIQEAMRDPLTGLCSRALFKDRTNAALEDVGTNGGGGPAILLIDLDRFKAVNDTLGHPVGDLLLCLVAKRLVSISRKSDLLARLGGDEFGLLVAPGLTGPVLASVAERLIDVLGRPYLVDGHLVNIGASIGVAAGPGDGADYATLSRNADLALYAAKNSGRGSYNFFEPAMDARALARRSMEIDLRRALALRQFELHYQAQIDLEQDIVVGFEALLRWRHPERGLVSPVDFIPLAEEIGLIVAMGEWVLREACNEAARWAGSVGVAVNVSARQFEDCDRLVDTIGKALARSGLPGERLEIEITESVLLRNETAVIAALHRVRAMGVRVAMDDFGTGYSSLSQLHSFPFDKIKIDRSFVRGSDDVHGQDAIIRAITALGVSLGMATIAEGVETPDQLARIRAEGCGSVQGYLFSKPLPVSQLDSFIAEYAKRRTGAAKA